MNRPSLGTYLGGNPITIIASIGCTGFLTYQWWEGMVSGFAPMAAGITMVACINARQKINDYADWKRVWDAMGDRSARRFPYGKVLKVIGGLVWLCYAFCMIGINPHKSDDMMIAEIFGGITLAAAIIILMRRARRRPAKPRVMKSVPVSVIAAGPGTILGPAKLRQDLPAYCAGLMSPPSPAQR